MELNECAREKLSPLIEVFRKSLLSYYENHSLNEIGFAAMQYTQEPPSDSAPDDVFCFTKDIEALRNGKGNLAFLWPAEYYELFKDILGTQAVCLRNTMENEPTETKVTMIFPAGKVLELDDRGKEKLSPLIEVFRKSLLDYNEIHSPNEIGFDALQYSQDLPSASAPGDVFCFTRDIEALRNGEGNLSFLWPIKYYELFRDILESTGCLPQDKDGD